MYFALKYARRKYNERKQANAPDVAVPEPVEPVEPPSSDAQPAAVQERVDQSDPIENAAAQPEKTTLIDEEKAQPLAKEKNDAAKEDPVEKKRRRKYRYRIIFGLMAPFALQALDTTIIASALPFIAQDFNQIKQLNWIISAFNLTSAAFLPFWAQVADIFGRHVTIHAAIVIMIIGSAICTGAPTTQFGVLLLGRGLQGVGTAGIGICVRIILADRVSLKDYALNWTLFSLASAVAYSIGPVVGGFLTETSWRWCFAINLPVAALAIALVLLLLRKELLGPQPLAQIEGRDASTHHGRFLLRLSTFDYGGQMLFLWGLGLLILALTWAGGTYSWKSAAVLAPLVLGGILSISWFFYEFSMAPPHLMSRVLPFQRAMIPWELLSQRDIGLLFFINLSSGMALFAVLYFMDLYSTLVQGRSASQGGISLLYILPGLGAGGYMAMFFTNVWPKQTLPALLLGNITTAVGITVLVWAINAERTAVIYGMMGLTGHGIGMRMNPGSLHGLAYFPTKTASIAFLGAFAMPFGGTLSLTLMSTVFNNKSGAKHINAKRGIQYGFIALVPFMWAAVILSTFLGNVWIKKDGGHEVVNGAYLWSFITRKKLVREQRTRGDDMRAEENKGEAAV